MGLHAPEVHTVPIVDDRPPPAHALARGNVDNRLRNVVDGDQKTQHLQAFLDSPGPRTSAPYCLRAADRRDPAVIEAGIAPRSRATIDANVRNATGEQSPVPGSGPPTSTLTGGQPCSVCGAVQWTGRSRSRGRSGGRGAADRPGGGTGARDRMPRIQANEGRRGREPSPDQRGRPKGRQRPADAQDALSTVGALRPVGGGGGGALGARRRSPGL